MLLYHGEKLVSERVVDRLSPLNPSSVCIVVRQQVSGFFTVDIFDESCFRFLVKPLTIHPEQVTMFADCVNYLSELIPLFRCELIEGVCIEQT